jgi:hypothetical protein
LRQLANIEPEWEISRGRSLALLYHCHSETFDYRSSFFSIGFGGAMIGDDAAMDDRRSIGITIIAEGALLCLAENDVRWWGLTDITNAGTRIRTRFGDPACERLHILRASVGLE